MTVSIFGVSPLDEMYWDWYNHPEYNGGDNAAFHQHMPVLRHMARGKTVLELGARFGTSTLAILAGKPTYLVSCDIEKRDTITRLEQLAMEANIPFDFFECDDMLLPEKMDDAVDAGNIYIPLSFDVLFIDTLHTHDQLLKELTLFHNFANEYIVMHDLVSFGRSNEDGNTSGPQGLIPAIETFLRDTPEWEVDSYWFNCNGLVTLRRKY